MSKKNKKRFWRNFSGPQENDVKRDREVEQSLRTIYGSEEGMPDLSHLDKNKSKRWIYFAVGIPLFVVLLCVAAWTGFLFFNSYKSLAAGKGLVLGIEGPDQVSLGEETIYSINYSNPLDEPLASVDMRVNFPSDFVVTEINPQTTEKAMVWKLGDLAAEEKGTITIKGRFIGALGTVSAIQAVATYRPASRTNGLEAMATKQVTYSGTVLEGVIEVPERAIPGDQVTIIYRLTNKAQNPLGKFEARIGLPEGFNFINATGSQDLLEGRVYKQELPILGANTSTEVKIIGTFALGFGGQAKVTAQAGSLSADNVFLPAQTSEASFPVLAGDLSLKLVVNGTDTTERSVGYGDNLQCALGYENTANETLKNVTIRLLLETVDLNNMSAQQNYALVDWDNLQITASTTRQDQALVWAPSKLNELKEIPQHGNGSFEVNVPLLSQATGTGMAAVKATIFADIEGIGDSKIKRTIQIAPMIFKFKSDASLSAEARYYSEEGAPLGEGPLPPKVGQATRYRVYWAINKQVHALKDINVSGVLPRNVRFVTLATSTAGEIAYDPSSRTVSWRLNRLPEGVQNAEMEFDVELTPTASDDGKFVELIGSSNFQAYDENIKENIIQVTKALSTDLQNDESAKGKGVVRK
ncbi:MAG: hypothetical protein PHC53_04135 [Patescibacteria group bacterium]|nr:hypothetical protein [Patescibacteria group bacterium]